MITETKNILNITILDENSKYCFGPYDACQVKKSNLRFHLRLRLVATAGNKENIFMAKVGVLAALGHLVNCLVLV